MLFHTSLVLLFHLLPTASMPRYIAGKTLPSQVSWTPMASFRAKAVTVPSGSHSQSSGDAPTNRQSEPPEGLDDGTGLPRTIAPNAVLLESHLAAVDAEVSTAFVTNLVSSSKKVNILLPLPIPPLCGLRLLLQ
jgi:hypothetical protein